jgi:hypothetical protein
MRILILCSLLFSSRALADAVYPEPEDCPDGSDATSSHAGEWCAEQTCDADEECPEGTSCETSSVCLDVYETSCGGWQPETGEPCTFEIREVLGDCESDDDCEVGTCVTDTRCIEPGLLESKTDDCSGCSQANLAQGTAGILGILGLLSLLRRRD